MDMPPAYLNSDQTVASLSQIPTLDGKHELILRKFLIENDGLDDELSDKSYIVVPNSSSSDEMSRLKSLCSIHGVGLVTFTLNMEQPDYVVVVLPAAANPDMFYVNTMLERLKASEPDLLNKLP